MGRRLSQLCPPYATPSSNSSLDYRRSDARIVESGFATSGGLSKSAKVVLVFLVVVLWLDLLLLLGDGLRLFGYRRWDNSLVRFRELQIVLRYVDQDRAVCFKRDGTRKLKVLLRFAPELFRHIAGHGPACHRRR